MCFAKKIFLKISNNDKFRCFQMTIFYALKNLMEDVYLLSLWVRFHDCFYIH